MGSPVFELPFHFPASVNRNIVINSKSNKNPLAIKTKKLLVDIYWDNLISEEKITISKFYNAEKYEKGTF